MYFLFFCFLGLCSKHIDIAAIRPCPSSSFASPPSIKRVDFLKFPYRPKKRLCTQLVFHNLSLQVYALRFSFCQSFLTYVCAHVSCLATALQLDAELVCFSSKIQILLSIFFRRYTSLAQPLHSNWFTSCCRDFVFLPIHFANF